MIITGLLIPMAGIILGSAIVFFTRHQMSELLQKTLFGFAAGVMMAAAVWSLLLPSIEMCDDLGKWATVPSALGFMLGIGFLLLIDIITPHLHFGTTKPEGPRSRLSRTTMLLLAVSIHHLPEGMAVGVVLAGAEHAETGITSMSALIVAAGIAIQNVPEGAIVSIPMRAAGKSRWKSFTLGCLSGAIQPIGAIAVILLSTASIPLLPYMLSFAAGAMLYVVVEELIPEASSGTHTNLSTIGFATGFVLMMMFDTIMA
ncbi:ZIP family metal transporter [Prevotella sp. P2-180]|uniref:ZIP family metal transporter n=1 Tax=Prevotella sp. P2-180 TaxID=2024224 RepID=UPI000B96C833|nr:ZIP family metal transporter [Prevotella sp. P2-180]MCI6338345.1 ZIP family metal transporter [Prevotella sp.]MCI7256890.1 ZIP family metal transporter [Prevotella sp.]MDD6862650.1 ZIP family metal transporter [Prevotella sp.]MDD7226098.1 ZIP family metal transporter [Prevotella sp.]OYP70031.1 ZIP zinc transporter [Prevotella sp. P2-180]